MLLDRFGVRRVGRISTLLWSIASFAAAAAPNLGAFFGARLLLGVGEAPTFPANAKAIGRWFPPGERTFATAIFDAAAKFASAIGVPFLGFFLLRLGWRWSFAFTGILSLLYFGLFTKVYYDPPDDPKLTGNGRTVSPPDQTSEKASNAATLSVLLREPKVLSLALGFGSYNYVFYLLLSWLPSYLSFSLHIDLLHSFLYTGFPWLFATVTDLLGAWLTDLLIKRGLNASRVRKCVLVCGTSFGLGLLGAAHAHTPGKALLWISLSLGGLSVAAPVGWSLPAIIVPRSSVGTVGGIINFCSQVSGIAAAIVTGYLVTATKSYALAFYVASAYLLIGIGSYLFLMGRIEPAMSLAAE